MGPWLVYAALLNGAAIALYQGAPLGRPFGVFVQQARVTMLGLVPSIARAWRASNCMQASSRAVVAAFVGRRVVCAESPCTHCWGAACLMGPLLWVSKPLNHMSTLERTQHVARSAGMQS